jgi:hypothetical protein
MSRWKAFRDVVRQFWARSGSCPCSCLPPLSFWVFPAVRRRQFDALQRLNRCAIDQDWLGRILAGSIGLYALALLAQPLAPRVGIPPRYGRAGDSLGR